LSRLKLRLNSAPLLLLSSNVEGDNAVLTVDGQPRRGFPRLVRRIVPCEIRELLWQATQPGTMPRASTASLLLLRLPIILTECRTARILVAPGLGYAAAQARRAPLIGGAPHGVQGSGRPTANLHPP